MSKRTHDPRSLDVAAACAAGVALTGQWPLNTFVRVTEGDASADTGEPVTWSAQFEQRSAHGAAPERYLRLQAATRLRRECQRCLQPVELVLTIDRALSFVDDEATAASLDADSDEDVLVASRQFDLQTLVEDELLLDMPLVPMHETCPSPLAGPMADAPEEPEAHPFAALAALKRGKGH